MIVDPDEKQFLFLKLRWGQTDVVILKSTTVFSFTFFSCSVLQMLQEPFARSFDSSLKLNIQLCQQIHVSFHHRFLTTIHTLTRTLITSFLIVVILFLHHRFSPRMSSFNWISERSLALMEPELQQRLKMCRLG